MDEYCIIYGGTDSNPGPFIIAVSKDQNLINGFREEHYHFCRGGEVVCDNNYNDLASDFEIEYKGGHYMTPVMTTKFIEYLTNIYNQLHLLADVFDRETPNLRFTDEEHEMVEEGLYFLFDHLTNMVPYEIADVVEESVYGSILNIEKCLDDFISVYEPEENIY